MPSPTPAPRSSFDSPPYSTPAPQASPSAAYLSGSQLVDLYRSYYFCYDHDASKNSCANYEALESVQGGYVTITKHEVWEAKSGALSEALGPGYDVAIIVSVQRLSIEGNLLCTSYADAQASIDRLSATTVRLDRSREPMMSVALNRLKAFWRKDIGQRACSRYRWDSGTLVEDAERDGRASQPSRIALLRERPILRVTE